MSLFFENARKIFETAEASLRQGSAASDVSILIAPEGGIHMICGSDWPLDRLLAHHAAAMAYRVSGRQGRVELEGMTASQTCSLKAEPPNAAALNALRDRPLYRRDMKSLM